MGDHDRRFSDSPTVGGSSAPENNYIIDGLSVTDPRYGTSGANLTMNFIQEVQVITSGFQAEYGRSTGGVFNVVTKSGSNQFHGDVFNYNRSKSWTDADLERRRNKQLTTFADQIASVDVGGSIGGPIARDKVWFFGAYGPIRRTTHLGSQIEDGIPIDTSGREFERNSDVYAAKVTWTPRSSHTLVLSTFGDPTEENGWLAGSTTGNNTPNADETSALRIVRSGGYNFGAKYTGVLGRTGCSMFPSAATCSAPGPRRRPMLAAGSRARSTRRSPCSSMAASGDCRTTTRAGRALRRV